MKEVREAIKNAALTKTQLLIANYILDNLSEVCFMTSTDIANAIGVSDSSIIRFSRVLGYGGFMDFQKDLRKNYQDKVLSISNAITIPAERIAKRSRLDPGSDYLNKHFKNSIKNLETAMINNSLKLYDDAANTIISSKRKYIMASRGNTMLADYCLLLMKHMLPNVEAVNHNAINPIDHICHISKDDCLILFSFPRYSSLDKIVAEMAANAEAKIIVITDKPSALLAQYAHHLFTVTVDNSTFFNSFIGAQFVMEMICETVSHKVKGIEKRLKKIDRYIGELGLY